MTSLSTSVGTIKGVVDPRLEIDTTQRPESIEKNVKKNNDDLNKFFLALLTSFNKSKKNEEIPFEKIFKEIKKQFQPIDKSKSKLIPSTIEKFSKQQSVNSEHLHFETSLNKIFNLLLDAINSNEEDPKKNFLKEVTDFEKKIKQEILNNENTKDVIKEIEPISDSYNFNINNEKLFFTLMSTSEPAMKVFSPDLDPSNPDHQFIHTKKVIQKVCDQIQKYTKDDKVKLLNQFKDMFQDDKINIIAIFLIIMKELGEKLLEIEQKEAKNSVQSMTTQLRSLYEEYNDAIQAGEKQQTQEILSAFADIAGGATSMALVGGGLSKGKEFLVRTGESAGSTVSGAIKARAAEETTGIIGFRSSAQIAGTVATQNAKSLNDQLQECFEMIRQLITQMNDARDSAKAISHAAAPS